MGFLNGDTRGVSDESFRLFRFRFDPRKDKTLRHGCLNCVFFCDKLCFYKAIGCNLDGGDIDWAVNGQNQLVSGKTLKPNSCPWVEIKAVEFDVTEIIDADGVLRQVVPPMKGVIE